MLGQRRRATFMLLLVVLLLRATTATTAATVAVSDAAPEDALLASGTIPADVDGDPVHAHEGWLMQSEGLFYWWGTTAKRNVSCVPTPTTPPTPPPLPLSLSSSSAAWPPPPPPPPWRWRSDAVALYTSRDLAAWRRRATVFSAAQLPPELRVYGISRPKVLYNAARRFYVLVFRLHAPCGAAAAAAGAGAGGAAGAGVAGSGGLVVWATSVSPAGPFVFEGARQPDGLPAGDLNVATAAGSSSSSGGSGRNAAAAYLVRSVPAAAGGGVAISRLDGDYLDTTGGVCARLLAGAPAAATAAAAAEAAAAAAVGALGAAPPPPPGAPVLFAFGGRWYLLATQRGGWYPSAPLLLVSNGSDPCAPGWRRLKRPAAGAGAATTFDSAPAFVFAFDGGGGGGGGNSAVSRRQASEQRQRQQRQRAFWRRDNPWRARVVSSDPPPPPPLPRRPLLVYFGDRFNAAGPGGVANASYVWLPLLPDGAGGGEQLQLRLVDPGAPWRPRDFLTPPPSAAAEAAEARGAAGGGLFSWPLAAAARRRRRLG